MIPPTDVLEEAPPVAVVDPRMRARRIEVRRSDARKRLHRLIAFGTAFGVIALTLVSLRSPLLDVDHINVVGADHTGVDVIRSASGIHRHQPLIDIDTGAARAKLLALPWVADVSVRRAWPATIDIKVTERTAAASEPAGQGGYALLDATGRVLGVDPAPPPGMLVVSGVAPAGTAGTTAPSDTTPALQVAAALPASLRPRLSGIDVASGDVRLLLALGGGAITLGPPDQLPAKLLAVLTVLEQVDLTDVCTIDVRVPRHHP